MLWCGDWKENQIRMSYTSQLSRGHSSFYTELLEPFFLGGGESQIQAQEWISTATWSVNSAWASYETRVPGQSVFLQFGKLHSFVHQVQPVAVLLSRPLAYFLDFLRSFFFTAGIAGTRTLYTEEHQPLAMNPVYTLVSYIPDTQHKSRRQGKAGKKVNFLPNVPLL